MKQVIRYQLSRWLNKGLILFTSAIIAIFLLLTTTTGLQLLIASVNLFSSGKIDYQYLTGSILSGKITIGDFQYRRNALRLSAQTIHLDFNSLGLLQKQLNIHNLEINNPKLNQFGNPDSSIHFSSHIDLSAQEKILDSKLSWLHLPFNNQGQLTIQNQEGTDNKFHWQLTGQYRAASDKPRLVRGTGDIYYDGTSWSLNNNMLKTENNTVNFNGQYSNQLHLSYQANLQTLSIIHPKLIGKIEAEGTISGPLTTLVHQTDIQIDSLALANQVRGQGQLHMRHEFNSQQLHATFNNGKLTLPLDGIYLQAMTAQFNSNDMTDAFAFSGHATGPEGKLSYHGQAFYADSHLKYEAHLEADNLQVKKTDEIKLWINGHANLLKQGNVMAINGDISIPKARITPKELTHAISHSPDAVIIDTPKISHQKQLALKANLTLQLGQAADDTDVTIDGFNIKSKLFGKLQLTKTPEQLLTATGDLHLIDTKYSLYGNDIVVSNGHLLYSQTPILNPAINLSAEKTLTIINAKSGTDLQLIDPNNSNTDDSDSSSDSLHQRQATITINVSGTVKHPTVTLYSNPTMSDSDKLSYLLLGVPSTQLSQAQGRLLFTAAEEMASSLGFNPTNDLMDKLNAWSPVDKINIQSSQYIDEESGESKTQTSLVLEKSLTPNFIISYTIGLINPVNLLQIEYRLSRRWHLRSQTDSTGQGGGDLIYTLEK